MTINRSGCHRIVLEFDKFVIKIPNFLDGWRIFLKGLLANINEQDLYKLGQPKALCPIIFGLSGGWGLVMKRAYCMSLKEFIYNIQTIDEICEEFAPFIEGTIDNFGKYDGKIVAIDYGGK